MRGARYKAATKRKYYKLTLLIVAYNRQFRCFRFTNNNRVRRFDSFIIWLTHYPMIHAGLQHWLICIHCFPVDATKFRLAAAGIEGIKVVKIPGLN